jgi:hypothetical protein
MMLDESKPGWYQNSCQSFDSVSGTFVVSTDVIHANASFRLSKPVKTSASRFKAIQFGEVKRE